MFIVMSSTHIRNITSDIKNTILEFIIDLKDNVFTSPVDQGDLALIQYFFSKLDDVSVSNHVVQHVLPYKNEISDRNVNFFIKKKTEIFKGLPADRVNYFVRLVTTPEIDGGLSTEDKETAWKYFDLLIALCEKYKKNK